MKKVILAGAVAAALMASTAFALTPAKDVGMPGDANFVTREAVITPETRWVNVDSGDTIKFVGAGGQSVVWHFVTELPKTASLGDIAPGVAGGRDIKVYIAQPDRD